MERLARGGRLPAAVLVSMGLLAALAPACAGREKKAVSVGGGCPAGQTMVGGKCQATDTGYGTGTGTGSGSYSSDSSWSGSGAGGGSDYSGTGSGYDSGYTPGSDFSGSGYTPGGSSYSDYTGGYTPGYTGGYTPGYTGGYTPGYTGGYTGGYSDYTPGYSDYTPGYSDYTPGYSDYTPGSTTPGGYYPGSTTPGYQPGTSVLPGGTTTPVAVNPGMPVTPGIIPGVSSQVPVFPQAAPRAAAAGAPPHVALVTRIRDRRLVVQVALSYYDQQKVRALTWRQDQKRVDAAGSAQADGNLIATGLALPVTVRFEFDGRQCEAQGSASFTPGYLAPVCR